MNLNVGDSLPSVPIVTDNATPPNQLPLSSGMYTMTWTIDNPGVLTVNAANLDLRALSPGNATILWTATPTGGSKYSDSPPVSYTDGPHTVLAPPKFVSLVVNH